MARAVSRETLAAALASFLLAFAAFPAAPALAANATGPAPAPEIAAVTTGTNPTVPASRAELPPFAIHIVPGSVIHLVSRDSKLPVSIRNDYPVEVRVQVHVAPTNLKALVPATIEVMVPAQTTYVATVPVSAIADGDVVLRAWLTTFSGLSLGPAVDLRLTVNAEIENSLIAGFAIIVAGLEVAGVVRTVSKRRRQETT
jgi:hypothetical protein